MMVVLGIVAVVFITMDYLVPAVVVAGILLVQPVILILISNMLEKRCSRGGPMKYSTEELKALRKKRCCQDERDEQIERESKSWAAEIMVGIADVYKRQVVVRVRKSKS